MATAGSTDGWVPVARETYQYGMKTWIGPKRRDWLDAWTRFLPNDPQKLVVLVPDRIHQAYMDSGQFGRVSDAQLKAIGYPGLPTDGRH